MIRHHYQRQLKDERAYLDLQIQEAESRLWEEDSGNRKLNAYILITSTKHKREKQECHQTFNLKPSDGDLLPAGSANH